MVELAIENLTFGYEKGHPLFKDVSVSLSSQGPRGKIVALMGRSGCGKTTLLRLLAGLERPWQGRIVTSPGAVQMSMIYQHPVFFDHLTVSGNAYYFERLASVRDRINREQLAPLVSQLNLKDILRRHKIDALSGGERQRLALFRALSIQPDILFLDEPCTGLDIVIKQEFLSYLRSVVESRGLLGIYVTHHADEASLVADDVVFLRRSDNYPITKIWRGEVADLIRRPLNLSMAELLLGPVFNRATCSLSNGLLKIGQRDVTFPVELQTGHASDVELVGFEPSQVQWSTDGVPVSWHADSSCYTFCTIDDDDTCDMRVVGPRHIEQPTSFRLNGRVFGFTKSGDLVGLMHVCQ